MTEGYIKLHRSIEEWEWASNPTMYYFWVRLLVVTNYKDKEWQGQVIPRGTIITSVSRLATEFALSVRQVRVCLERLTKSKQIVTQTTNKWTKITVCNFDSYQCQDEASWQTNDEQNARDVTNTVATTVSTLSPSPSEPNGSSGSGSKDRYKKSRNKTGAGAPACKSPDNSVERIYSVYPTRCPISGRQTGKGRMSKKTIERMLKSRSEENITQMLTDYLTDCIKTNSYIANFDTTLHRIERGDFDSQPLLVEDVEPARSEEPNKNTKSTFTFVGVQRG